MQFFLQGIPRGYRFRFSDKMNAQQIALVEYLLASRTVARFAIAAEQNFF